MWVTVIVSFFCVISLLMYRIFPTQKLPKRRDPTGVNMSDEQHFQTLVVFEPDQCSAEVNHLIDQFIDVESTLDLKDLQEMVEETGATSDRLHLALTDLKAHLVLPPTQSLIEFSIEEYVVQIESVMRDYVCVIMSASQQSQDAFKTTQKLLKQIDAIFSLVDGLRHIADQTGLIALNATIEAAKTGHVGRSYSYMAQEVQRLSAQSESFGGDIRKEMFKAKNSVETTATLIDQMVISDIHIALETRSSVDQLIGQLQGLSLLDMLGDPKIELYATIFKEMHKIVVVVLMKIDLIERLGLVDQQFLNKLKVLNLSLKSLYLAKVVKK